MHAVTLHALQDVGDAVDATRDFLFPFDGWRWLKLAVVGFFIGGTSAPSIQSGANNVPNQLSSDISDPTLPFTLPENALWILAGIVTVLVLFWLVFAIVGAVMEFVFIESLRSGDVTIRRYWSRRWQQGLRLFGFRVAIGLPMLAIVAGWLAIVAVPYFTGGDPTASIGLFLLVLPVVVLAGLVYWLVSSFTTVFVVPIMIHEEAGVLTGWRRLWSSIRSEWKQYLTYVLVNIALVIATGILASLALALGTIVVAIPLVILAVVTYLTVSFSTTLGLVIFGTLVVVFFAIMVVVRALIQVPILAYLRYYALLVLGDVEPGLDLIPHRRPIDTEE